MNESEKTFYDMASSNGYEIYKGGYPDFLLISPETKKPFFVEVKLAKHRIPRHQQTLHSVIRSKLGFPCLVWRPGDIFIDPTTKEMPSPMFRMWANKLIGDILSILNDLRWKINLDNEFYEMLHEVRKDVFPLVGVPWAIPKYGLEGKKLFNHAIKLHEEERAYRDRIEKTLSEKMEKMYELSKQNSKLF